MKEDWAFEDICAEPTLAPEDDDDACPVLIPLKMLVAQEVGRDVAPGFPWPVVILIA